MNPETEIIPSISEQAAQWWTLFRDEDVSSTDHDEFAEWAARGPERVEAYLRVARLQRALDDKKLRWPTVPAEDLIREAKFSGAEPLPFSSAHRRPRADAGRPRRSVGMPIAVGLAASVLAAVAIAWLSWDRPQQYQTRLGEQRSVLLEDGSRATLNSSSRIEVHFTGKRRHILLAEGEALFEVEHDRTRPFEVQTGHALMRAVGTQFDVDRRHDRTIITVVEGRVSLAPVTATPQGTAPLALLEAADQMVIADLGPQPPQHGVNVRAALSWTHQQLVFERQPLGEVAEEFNRYNRGRIEIRGEALRAQQVTGVFRTDDAASFVSFLSSIPGVQIVDDGRGGYLVTSGQAPPRP